MMSERALRPQWVRGNRPSLVFTLERTKKGFGGKADAWRQRNPREEEKKQVMAERSGLLGDGEATKFISKMKQNLNSNLTLVPIKSVPTIMIRLCPKSSFEQEKLAGLLSLKRRSSGPRWLTFSATE